MIPSSGLQLRALCIFASFPPLFYRLVLHWLPDRSRFVLGRHLSVRLAATHMLRPIKTEIHPQVFSRPGMALSNLAPHIPYRVRLQASARLSGSSMPTTIRTSRAISERIPFSSGCHPAPRRMGASRRLISGVVPPYPAKNAGWALEISLDVEIAHAICPNCKILLVEADSNSLTNLLAAISTGIRLGATVVSNSWGSSEFSGETSYETTLNHPGVAITVSSGDNGYGVEWPAASPFVTAVGGTTLKLDKSNNRISETVWSGAGSGCSAYEPKPSWQRDSGCTRRTVADVAADADPNTGAAIYDTVRYQGRSGWFQVGGTSLASPLIAAVYALAGNASTVQYGSYLYSHTSGLFDITSGSNGTCGSYLCTGLSGYDGPTGNGSPLGVSAF